MTVSAIGKMGMPGYALYSSSKFAVQGFQQALRLEMPKNIKMTCLYPVATDTNFFKAAVQGQEGKGHPSEALPRAEARARRQGYGQGGWRERRSTSNPCKLFSFAMALFAVMPFVRSIYWAIGEEEAGQLRRPDRCGGQGREISAGRGSSMKRHIGRIFAVLLVVAALAAVLAGLHL